MKKRLLSLMLVFLLAAALIPVSASAASATCTVSFDAHGGEGEMKPVTVNKGSEYTLPECKFTKSGRDFYRWSVNGVEKEIGDKITINNDITLTAIWSYKRTYKVDNAVDKSTTEIIGTISLTDTSTGQTFDMICYDEVCSSSFTEPRTPSVLTSISEAEETVRSEAANRAGGAELVNLNVTVSDPRITKTVDNRVYTTDYAPGYDDDGDYYAYLTESTGDYSHNWCFYVTLEAEYDSSAAAEIIRGDADGDGEVTVLDATAIQRHLANIHTRAYYEEAANVDGDSEVSILDATAIQRYLAAIENPYDIGAVIS